MIHAMKKFRDELHAMNLDDMLLRASTNTEPGIAAKITMIYDTIQGLKGMV